jgi:hypothetical protein
VNDAKRHGIMEHKSIMRSLSQQPRLEPLSGKPPGHVLVHEIYKSIQGESTFAGLPCVFIRLTEVRGCPKHQERAAPLRWRLLVKAKISYGSRTRKTTTPAAVVAVCTGGPVQTAACTERLFYRRGLILFDFPWQSR